MTRYGRSPWVDEFPKSRVPAHPRQRGALATDVVIIGGGLVGCATAYALAAVGVNVTLVEAALIGRGASGSAGGWISEDPGVAFVDLEKTHGLGGARHVFHAWRRAALDFVALLRRLDVKCHLEARGALTLAATIEQAARMRRDQKSRRGAGLDAAMLTARIIKGETALDAALGLRARDGATIDPYRACLGLASAAARRGAVVFERSPVRAVTFNRKTAEVITAGGRIRTNRVVVATGAPTALFKGLVRHFWFRSRYFALTKPVPAKIRQQLGRRVAVVRDSADPPHLVRWVGDDRVLVCGADGAAEPARLREAVAIQRTGQLMYELSTLYPDLSGIQPDYGWAADYARSGDGLPYIGPHRNYPHHLFVLGDASHGVTGAYLASRMLLRHYLDEPDPHDALFSFSRHGR